MARASFGVLTGMTPHANVPEHHASHGGPWARKWTSCGRGMDGTEHEFPEQLARHRPSLERSARRLCRNRQDAEDLVQTTLERAWKAREQFLPGGNIGGWLFRILCNRHRDDLRRRTGVQVPLPDELPDPAPATEELSSLLATPPETVLAAMSQLPPDLRAPLELLAMGGKRYREIAEELEIPINTVGTWIRRARQKLQEIFGAARARPRGANR